MTRGPNQPYDPEDYFADTRMSFGDHLEDLRVHLWRAIYGFLIALVFSFFIGNPVLQFIAAPVESQLNEFYDRRVEKVLIQLKTDQQNGQTGTALQKVNEPSEFVKLAFVREQLELVLKNRPAEEVNAFPQPRWAEPEGKPPQNPNWLPLPPWLGGTDSPRHEIDTDPERTKEVKPADVVTLWVSHVEPLREVALQQKAQRQVGKRPGLTTLSIQEAFVVYVKVCLVTGLVIGSPWIFFQVWMFVAAGLYPHEKRLVNVYLPVSLGLFLGGVFICEFFVMPKAVAALLWFNEWIGMEPDLRLNEWLGFAILMPVVFGVSFQTPLVMLFLERIGIMTVEGFRKQRRLIYFLMAVFAAVITPSTDPISMLLLWLPMCMLFELGIFLCRLSPRPVDFGSDLNDSDELIEV